MKLKNIKVGDFIEAKNKHGGDIGLNVLEVGKSYEVLGFNEGSDLSVIIAVPNHKTFHDGFYVSHECFRKPKLKQADHSVFKGRADYWKFFAIDEDGQGWFYRNRPSVNEDDKRWMESNRTPTRSGRGYDASNWRDSLIERDDIAKELLEVDLSSELTGSDYYYSKSVTERLENGQELVMCFVSNVSESDAMQDRHVEVITSVDTEFNDTDGYGWQYAVPINNQGEPLTAKDVGI